MTRRSIREGVFSLRRRLLGLLAPGFSPGLPMPIPIILDRLKHGRTRGSRISHLLCGKVLAARREKNNFFSALSILLHRSAGVSIWDSRPAFLRGAVVGTDAALAPSRCAPLKRPKGR